MVSAENSTSQIAKEVKKVEKRPMYYILDNCYLCTWGPIKPSSQTQACVVYFATGELVMGYLQLKNKSLVFSGPMFMVAPSGSLLLCECSDGLLDGVGLLRLANGDVVISEWKEGLKHGSSVSYNIESNKKVFATFKRGEVKSLDKTDPSPISAADLEEMFPEVDLSLEELVSSSPLFAMDRVENLMYIGTSDLNLGLKLNGVQSFDVGFFKDEQPHGHCRRIELDGNFVDGMFSNGDLEGPAVCFLKEMGLWTFGIYHNFTILETKDVYTNNEIMPLASLTALDWPASDFAFVSWKKDIEPFIELNPFFFSEVEAEYIKSAMDNTTLPFNLAATDIGMFLPAVEIDEGSQCMEAISEEPTLEDEEEELGTKNCDEATKRCSESVSKRESKRGNASSKFLS